MNDFIRIFASANIDHISPARGELRPLCKQQLRTGSWHRLTGFDPGPMTAVRLCRRCEALYEQEVQR